MTDIISRTAALIAAALALANLQPVAQEPPTPVPAAISQLGWLGGTWTGTSGATVFEERWTPPAGGSMLGVARTIAKDRMVAFEFLRIISRNGSLVYVAQPNGRPPTEFRLSAMTADSATFENPTHDFPKVIRYTLRPDGILEARVSDGGTRSQTFQFRRQTAP
jgi:hypothetical protein